MTDRLWTKEKETYMHKEVSGASSGLSEPVGDLEQGRLLRMLELEAQNPPVGECGPNGKRERRAGLLGAAEKGKGGAPLPVPNGDLRWPAIAPSLLPIADITIMTLMATRLRHLSHGVFPEQLVYLESICCPLWAL